MANPPRKRSASRELKGILDDLEGEEKVSVEKIRAISVQFGFALSASIQHANSPGSLQTKKEVRHAWTKLADSILEFALED